MVTVPTIDQISGTTVMNKLRALIRKFIEFATDVSDEMSDVAEQSQEAYNIASSININNYYTKVEVDALISGIDLSQFYTKLEVDAIIGNYYTKTEIDNALALKQNNLTAITPIKIDSNNISLKDWVLYDNNDWTIFIDENNCFTEDLVMVIFDRSVGIGIKGSSVISFSTVGYITSSIAIAGMTNMSLRGMHFNNSSVVQMSVSGIKITEYQDVLTVKTYYPGSLTTYNKSNIKVYRRA